MPDLLPLARRIATASFGVDYRGLAICRIIVGGIVIGDVLQRCTYVTAFHSTLGLMPAHENTPQPMVWSLHRMSRLGQFHFVMFCVEGCAGVAMLVGWHSRVSSVLCYILYCSSANHNMELNQGGDGLVVAVMIYG